MRSVISAWPTSLLAAACLLGLPASQVLAADKPPRPRPVLLPDSEPAGVIVSAPQPFTDGWEQIEQLIGDGEAK